MTLDIPVCACGMEMVRVKEGHDLFACLNCDGVQLGEIGDDAFGRVKTVQDVRFKAEWARRVRQFYPDEGRAAA